MREQKAMTLLMVVSLIVCLIFYGLVQHVGLSYTLSSLSKVVLFGVVGCVYYYITTKKNPLGIIIRTKELGHFKLSLGLGLGVLLIIWVAYFAFKSLIDLNLITRELLTSSNITEKTFPYVALYITIGNSFLEEIFFRGFIFLQIYGMGYKKTAYIFSSGLFAIYHMSIFKSWFNPLIMLLCLLGLFVGGLIFNYINVKSRSILNSWLIHACANVAIMTIGIMMFYFQ